MVLASSLYSRAVTRGAVARPRGDIRKAGNRIKHPVLPLTRPPGSPVPPPPLPARSRPLARPPASPPEHRTPQPLAHSPARRISRWRALDAWQADVKAANRMVEATWPLAKPTRRPLAHPLARTPGWLRPGQHVRSPAYPPTRPHARLLHCSPSPQPTRPLAHAPRRPPARSSSRPRSSPLFCPHPRSPARPPARPLPLPARPLARLVTRHPVISPDRSFLRERPLEGWEAGSTVAGWMLPLGEIGAAQRRRGMHRLRRCWRGRGMRLHDPCWADDGQ